jgi:hypothetical protein
LWVRKARPAWVDDVIKVMQAAAEKTGWASVPWERLLEELIAIEPPKGQPLVSRLTAA